MSKRFITILLASFLLTGAGCAPVMQDSTEAGIENGEQMHNEVVFENGAYLLNSEASSIGWEASKRVGPTHTGTIHAQEGALLIQEGTVVGGSLVVDMQSIVDIDLTDAALNDMLVTHLKSDDFFAVESNPTSTFALTDMVPVEGLEGFTHRMDGTLTIKGIEQEISFPVSVTADASMIHVVGTLILDRSKWNVRYGSGTFFDDLGDNLIEDEFTLMIDVVFAQGE